MVGLAHLQAEPPGPCDANKFVTGDNSGTKAAYWPARDFYTWLRSRLLVGRGKEWFETRPHDLGHCLEPGDVAKVLYEGPPVEACLTCAPEPLLAMRRRLRRAAVIASMTVPLPSSLCAPASERAEEVRLLSDAICGLVEHVAREAVSLGDMLAHHLGAIIRTELSGDARKTPDPEVCHLPVRTSRT